MDVVLTPNLERFVSDSVASGPARVEPTTRPRSGHSPDVSSRAVVGLALRGRHPVARAAWVRRTSGLPQP